MTRARRLILGAALVVAVCVSATACASSSARPVEGKKIKHLDASFLPSEVAGLKVSAEDVSAVGGSKKSFVEEVGLYSLRRDELLQATLQVSRFTEDADVHKADFRQAVVQQIGSSVPRSYRMGDDTVYLTSGRRQSVAVWFRDRYLLVLSTREEFPAPRSLLRSLLEVQP